jgi:hypothetical protein
LRSNLEGSGYGSHSSSSEAPIGSTVYTCGSERSPPFSIRSVNKFLRLTVGGLFPVAASGQPPSKLHKEKHDFALIFDVLSFGPQEDALNLSTDNRSCRKKPQMMFLTFKWRFQAQLNSCGGWESAINSPRSRHYGAKRNSTCGGYHMTRWRCKLMRGILPTWHSSKA